ncbi:MAG: hypothetical protein JW915_03225, partial [Chitinispirillaceae bacterium]|nr:hypothetical protein [Chitinispirillaceae bacterium]
RRVLSKSRLSFRLRSMTFLMRFRYFNVVEVNNSAYLNLPNDQNFKPFSLVSSDDIKVII